MIKVFFIKEDFPLMHEEMSTECDKPSELEIQYIESDRNLIVCDDSDEWDELLCNWDGRFTYMTDLIFERYRKGYCEECNISEEEFEEKERDMLENEHDCDYIEMEFTVIGK